MRAVAPRIKGVDETTAAAEQEEYREITIGIGVTENGVPTIVTRWKFEAEERERVLNGEDLFITIISPRLTMPPLVVSIGFPYGELES